MKRWLTTVVVFALCSVAVRADVTIVQTTTVEGGMAAMGGGNVSPKMTARVKGKKMRNDVEVGPNLMSTIMDLTSKQMILLHHDQKTATVTSPGAPDAKPLSDVTLPVMDTKVTPTGKSQVIDGLKCDEYAFTTAMNMGEMTGPQMPPEATAMMKDMRMNMAGSIWVAKEVPAGPAEYVAFLKAASASDMASMAAGASGVNIPGLDKMMKAMANVDGMPYLTEMTMTIEGTGQIADMMKQMGPMKITTRVTSVKTDPIPDDQFQVPPGYREIKQ
ncbi:MAG TPA: DUF4412 domain-containing protein [Vicinamibacterales bacterium]|nr:DUF4412 domain-containing protein [Vicinamibacterales bacterium]